METKTATTKQLSENLEFNPLKQEVKIAGEIVKLTTKESELLDILSDNVNELTEREKVLTKIWVDANHFNARSMDVYICRLRKLLQPLENIELLNVHGKGYKLIINQN